MWFWTARHYWPGIVVWCPKFRTGAKKTIRSTSWNILMWTSWARNGRKPRSSKCKLWPRSRVNMWECLLARLKEHGNNTKCQCFQQATFITVVRFSLVFIDFSKVHVSPSTVQHSNHWYAFFFTHMFSALLSANVFAVEFCYIAARMLVCVPLWVLRPLSLSVCLYLYMIILVCASIIVCASLFVCAYFFYICMCHLSIYLPTFIYVCYALHRFNTTTVSLIRTACIL